MDTVATRLHKVVVCSTEGEVRKRRKREEITFRGEKNLQANYH